MAASSAWKRFRVFRIQSRAHFHPATTVIVGELDNDQSVVNMSNMPGELMLRERIILTADSFAEIVVWKVPRSVVGSAHRFKYRLALIVNGARVLGYDNEAGKGDHRHLGAKEFSYAFTTPERLLADFWADVDEWST